MIPLPSKKMRPHRYGSIESIRRRSVPVALDAKMSRKAAIITGNVSDKRGTSHAYVVFQDEAAALAALASNMHMVCPVPPCVSSHPNVYRYL